MRGITSSEMAGSIIRRVREDRGISRAALAQEIGIGARTLYALETGESENFGLGKYLKLLDALGLSMDITATTPLPSHASSTACEGDTAVCAQQDMVAAARKLPQLDSRWTL